MVMVVGVIAVVDRRFGRSDSCDYIRMAVEMRHLRKEVNKMSIVIKGIDMPKGNSTKILLIYSDGRVFTGIKDDIDYFAEELPSADVRPVVRCSECANNYSTPHNPMCDYMDATLYPDSFCSKGKPKEVDCTDCIKNGGDWGM